MRYLKKDKTIFISMPIMNVVSLAPVSKRKKH